MSTVLYISGMRDYACREAVARALEAVPGVVEVDVNLLRAVAAVSHDAARPPADLVRAIERAGYRTTLSLRPADSRTPGPEQKRGNANARNQRQS